MAYQNDRITSIPAPLPKDYDRGFSFTDFQTINPGDPMPGAQMDNEFANIEQALDETQARARLIQRDDGALANSSVGLEQLKPESYNALSGTGVIQLSDITSLSSLNTAALVDGQQFKRKEFWPGTGVGGVDLSWKANEPVANHNGGTIIDPAKISELDTGAKTFGTYFTPDTVSGNTGCFVASVTELSPALFGALLDDTPCADAVIACFQEACDSGKKVVPDAGSYGLEKTVSWTMTGNFSLDCPQSAVFKALSSVPVDNKLIQPTPGSSKKFFSWVGAKVDGRLLPARSVGAPDLIYISGANISPVVVAQSHLIVNDDRSGTAGDSCLFAAEGEDYLFYKNTLQGAVDAGIYISGDSTETLGRRCIVEGNIFIECSASGFISKRSFEDQAVVGNIFNGCKTAVATGSADGTKLPGKKLVITHNLIRDVERGIMVRQADGSVVSSNRIEDYAVNAAGTAINDFAIYLSGSSNCTVSSNLITQLTVTPTAGSMAVKLEPWTYDSVTYETNDNSINNNTIVGAYNGIIEDASNADRNKALYNNIVGTTLPVSMKGANSFSVEVDSGTGSVRHIFGDSGSAPISSAKTVWENDDTLDLQFLMPSNRDLNFIVGDENSAFVARMAYLHALDEWQWRAGGSGAVFKVSASGPRLPAYTVASLPTSAIGDGQSAYASDGRKNGEGAGAGTGVQVFYDGTNWIAVDTGQTVAA